MKDNLPIEHLPVEHQALAILTLNQILLALKWLVTHIEPVLGPLLVLVQIVVAVFTAVWIYRRATGAKIDNQIKQKELDKK
jgi:uncharacterized membrane protein